MSPTLAMRRGACPTLDRPMQTGDGLLARLRLPNGVLSPEELENIAQLAQEHGNGLIEITARGNLQVRGLTTDSAAAFAATISRFLNVETGLVVETSPLAGDDPQEIADPRPLADAIRAGSATFSPRLAPKLSVVIDGNGQVSLSGLKADIRLLAIAADGWAVTVGRHTPRLLSSRQAAALTLETLGKLARLGPSARAHDLAMAAGNPDDISSQTLAAPPVNSSPTDNFIGTFTRNSGTTTGIALPFGAGDSTSLIAFARAAHEDGVARLRLAPGRTLLADNASGALVAIAGALGFITQATDPRRRVSACAGSEGCRSGHIPARRLAAQYADQIGAGKHLHISGCAKGCARPGPADFVLVGHEAGIGLVFDGRAGDTPQDIVQSDGIETALRRAQEGR